MTSRVPTLTAKGLTRDAFRDFGTFADLTEPAAVPLVADDKIKFWPELVQLDLGPMGNNQVSSGICQVRYRPLEIVTSEYHSFAGEGILPLDGNVYLHLARPTADG